MCVLHSLDRYCVCTAQSRRALCLYCTVYIGILCVLHSVESYCVFTSQCRDVLLCTAPTRETIKLPVLTPWCRVLLEQLTSLQLVKKFPAFHGTRSFITALTSVCHLSLSLARPIQSIYPHPASWRSFLFVCYATLPPDTLLPGYPTYGVVYLRIVLSPQESSRM